MVSETIDGCPVFLIDAGTFSGFEEDPNVWHSSYRQHGCGWVLNSGNFPIAYLDREGRVETRSYRFDLGFTGLVAPFSSTVHVHEHGNQIFLDIEKSPDGTGNAAVIRSAHIPRSIRPHARVYGTLCAIETGAEVVGTFVLWPDGEIVIYGGVEGTVFVGNHSGFHRFQIQYDIRPFELL